MKAWTRRLILFCSSLLTLVILAIIPRYRDVGAYSQKTTHVQLAKRTVELAASNSSYYELLGFTDLITKADQAEDEGSRGDNHFYDPSTGTGLATNSWVRVFGKIAQGKGRSLTQDAFPRYMSALDWATDKMVRGPGLDGKSKELDWKGAIEAYDYTSDAKRDAYEAVGHVLHLLQDMGQPDHVALRPHPCNYLREYLSPVLPDRAGYESLWEREDESWSKGKAPENFKTLGEGFTRLAKESRQAERQLGLPMSDELALGCGPATGQLAVGAVSALAGDIYDVVEWPGTAPWSEKFYDHVWQRYEFAIPAVPTIPWPPGDSRTEKYLDLGKTLLPRVEQYGAGLLRLFHDIVSQPPFVEEVEIYQRGQQKYRKTWKEEQTGDPPHVQSRRAEVEGDGELEAGVDAEVVIRIGPKDPDPKLHSAAIRRELKSLNLTIVPEGGKPEEAMPVSVGSGGEPNSPRGGIWKGHFTPSRSATLRIEAVDVNEHYKDVGGRREQSLTPVDGRRGTQGDLDADPSTAARATWPEPYPWKGYEAGADTNHHFSVRTPCGPVGQKALEDMRWGTWTGTVMAYDRDYKPRPLEAQLSVSFRAAFQSADPGGTSPLLVGDLLSALFKPPLIQLGRVRGSGSWTSDYQPYGQTSTLSGTVSGSIGRLDFTDLKTRSNPPLLLTLSAQPRGCPGPGCPGNGIEISLVGGDRCIGSAWRGKITRDQVQQMVKETHSNLSIGFPGWSEVSWNLQFTPSAPPPHVTAEVSYRRLSNAIAAGLGGYGHQLQAELMPILVGLGRAGKQNEWQRLHDAWYSHDNPCMTVFPRGWEKTGRPHSEALEKLIELWVPTGFSVSPSESDAELDEQYNQQLKQLEAVLAQWRQLKRSSDAECATATETLATVVQSVSPNDASAVRSLRELAQKIRESGIESLAAGNP